MKRLVVSILAMGLCTLAGTTPSQADIQQPIVTGVITLVPCTPNLVTQDSTDICGTIAGGGEDNNFSVDTTNLNENNQTASSASNHEWHSTVPGESTHGGVVLAASCTATEITITFEGKQDGGAVDPSATMTVDVNSTSAAWVVNTASLNAVHVSVGGASAEGTTASGAGVCISGKPSGVILSAI